MHPKGAALLLLSAALAAARYPVKRGVRVQNAFGGTPRQGSGIVRRPRGRGGITIRVVRG